MMYEMVLKTLQGGNQYVLQKKILYRKKEFVDIFNAHFNNTNLPNQLKYGSRLIGRWMKEKTEDTVEVFAIWEFDCYEEYQEIEANIRSDKEHVKRIQDWYQKHGGRERVYEDYIL